MQSLFPSTRLSEKGPHLGPRHPARCLPRVGVMGGWGRVGNGEEQSPDSISVTPPPPPISFLPSTLWLPLPVPSFSFSSQSGEGMGGPLPKSRPPCGSHWSHQHKVNIKRPLLSIRPGAGYWHKARNQNQFLKLWGFPDGSDGKAFACNAGDHGSIPGSGRFPWRRKW